MRDKELVEVISLRLMSRRMRIKDLEFENKALKVQIEELKIRKEKDKLTKD